LHFSCYKNLIVKEKKRKKKAKPSGCGAKKPKGNAINDGAVLLGCVYGVVFCFFSVQGAVPAAYLAALFF